VKDLGMLDEQVDVVFFPTPRAVVVCEGYPER
jgi:hypothetical protein